MSRKKKSGTIPVELIEVKGSTEGDLKVHVQIHGETVGSVTQEKDESVIACFPSGREQTFPTLNDGVEAILREYNLHN